MKKKMSILVAIASICLIICITTVFAETVFRSFIVTKGTIKTDGVDKVVDVENDSIASVEIYSETSTINLLKAGDIEDISFEIRNRTSSIIQYRFKFAFDSPYNSPSNSLASSILVYYNDNFVNSLANVCYQNGEITEGVINLKGYLNKATNAYTSQTDKITFELLRGSDGSIIESNSAINLKISIVAQTVNYKDFMYVSTLDELKKSVQDLNTGILDNPTIVLLNDLNVNENIEFKYPFTLNLNGYALNNSATLSFTQAGLTTIKSDRRIKNSISTTGSYVMNNSEGLLYVENMYDENKNLVTSNISSKLTATNYNNDLLYEILINKIENECHMLLEVNQSYDILKGLTPYSPVITTSAGLSYTKPNLVVSLSQESTNEYIVIDGKTINFKIKTSYDDDIYESILENELGYISSLAEVNSTGGIIRTNSKDLYLPTAIKEKNATLEWRSNNLNIISNEGVISDDMEGNQVVTLSLVIRINTSVYTKNFTIRLMAQNHETLFDDFVAQLSPIRVDTLYKGNNSTNAYYYLPIVDSNYSIDNADSYTGYDYRNSYETPEGVLAGSTVYQWSGFSNVGFEYITYTLIPAYNFIGLDNNAVDSNSHRGVAVYLSQATFQTFAQINVTAKFENDDEIYSSVVNILVNTGYSTELNELVFSKVAQDLNNVNVLQNILDTRKESGMIGENGDFRLDGVYNTYFITYSIPEASRNAITKITGYDDGNNEVASITGNERFTSSDVKNNIKYYVVSLNPEYFENTDSVFGINTILVMPTGEEYHEDSRIQYFNTPGVIKPDQNGFDNLSVFNSVKYQVWHDLANNVLDESYEDDVRSDNYTTTSDTLSFTTSGNTITNHTKAYILCHDANLCETLAFSLTESVTSTDNHLIYGLSKVIDFILSDTTKTFGEVYTGDISFESSFVTENTGVKSNGRKYITDTEKTLLKNYYLNYIKNDSQAFEEMYSNSTYQVMDEFSYPKYVLVNGDVFASSVQSYYNNTSTYGANGTDGTYGKFLEVLQWAHNDKDSTHDATGVIGEPPCMALIGIADWTFTSDDTWTKGTTYTYGSWANSKYAKSIKNGDEYYLEDETTYITKGELEILMVALLNSKSSLSNSSKTYIQTLKKNHFVIPSYLSETGIRTIIETAYNDLEKSVSGDSNSGFTAEMTSFTTMGVTYTTPHIVLMDGSTAGFDYFPNLKTMIVIGDYNNHLKAFNTTDTLNNFYTRLISNNTKIENLALEYVSDSYVDFDISNIYKFRDVSKINISHNHGITNIGSLLKFDFSKLGYVDVFDIGQEFKYEEFVLQALKLKTSATVYYSDGSVRNEYLQSLSPDAEGLIYIDEFDELVAENLNLTQIAYTPDSQKIIWGIEEGNGIQKVEATNVTLPTLTPYTNYFLATDTFTYDGMNFETGCIYLIYLDGSNIRYQKQTSIGQVIVGTPAESLSDDEITQYISDNNLTPQEVTSGRVFSYTNNDGTWDEFDSSTGAVSLWSGSSSTITITNRDGNTQTVSSVRGFGYSTRNTTTRTATISNQYAIYHDSIAFNVERYYAVYENGIYTIRHVTYVYNSYDSATLYSANTTYNESVYDFYYMQRSWFTNNYYSLLNDYPNAAYVTVDGQTYDLLSDTYHFNSTYVSENISGSQNYGGDTQNEQISNDEILNAFGITSTVATNLETMLSARYYRVTTAKTYRSTESTTYTIAAGTYEVGLKTLAQGGGFSYTNASSNLTNIQLALAMENILAEANSHYWDLVEGLQAGTPAYSSFGIYYHNYYAYTGATITINGHTYTHNNIYRMVEHIDPDNFSNSYFEFSQDGMTENEKYFTEITGTQTNIVNVITELSYSDVGKVYYYTGTANEALTQGTNIWYHVLQNEETGAYELIKFGELGVYNDIVNATNGSFYQTLPSRNNDGLRVVCNIVKYRDDATNSTRYEYGVGGERKAVLRCIINVGGIDYTRYFVIKVIG